MVDSTHNDMWRYSITGNRWEYLNGNKSINTSSDLDAPYLGGVYSHTMCIIGDYMYVYGGYGYENSTIGIIVFIH